MTTHHYKVYLGGASLKYFKDFLEYISIDENQFYKTIDSFRQNSLWTKNKNGWELKYAVWK